MPTAPSVSIVVPVHNREALVGETIGSLLAQTYERLQIVIVDDGSTDGSGAVIERLAAAHPDRIVAVRHENRGQALSTNRGFEIAGGELLGYLSSDDLLLPTAVATLVEALGRRPEAVLAYPDFLMADERGEPFERVSCGDFALADVLRDYDPVIGPGALIRRSAIERAGGMDPAFPTSADFEWWLRLAFEGPFAWVPEPLALYRRHAGMLSQTSRSPEMASLPVKLIDHFYAREDLAEELLEIRGEAYRTAYMVGAILCTGEDDLENTRFDVRDRRAIAASAGAEVAAAAAERGTALEQLRTALDESRATIEDRERRIARLREAIEAQRATIARLRAEPGERR